MAIETARFSNKEQLLSSVKPVEAILSPQLKQLLEKYTERLNEKVATWKTETRPRSVLGEETRELLDDIQYLSIRTSQLVAKASAYRELSSLTDADKLEVELYLFDAEDSLRAAQKILSRYSLVPKF